MKIMPTLAFAMLGLTATPGGMQTGTVQTGPVQTAYDIAASAPVTKADAPTPQLGVVVADRSNGVAAPAPAAPAKYDPGASSTEIKIGNIMPYTGPAAAYGLIGKTVAAYFKKINAEGGINGRKINFVSYDDAYNPQ
jgi:ABC-type branched-subunit amino acid transport system substrate-binding protein